MVLYLLNSPHFFSKSSQSPRPKLQTLLVRPKNMEHHPCPIEAPKEIAEDYKEACNVLADSPKA
jgi:hypothetical protein